MVNAYVMTAVRAYLERLADGAPARGYGGRLFVMQSGGGIATVDAMARFPVRMIESGPAAGALMAAAYGKLTGHADLVAFDMGGTTAKLSLIAGGAPQTIREFELHRIRLQPGSGIPMNIQAIDLVEIGAGGGSIARAEMGVIERRPGVGGRRARPHLLRPRRDRADRHRRQPRPRLPQPRLLPRRAHEASTSRAPAEASRLTSRGRSA